MPRRDWVHHVAIVGAIALGVALSLTFLGLAGQGYFNQQQQQANPGGRGECVTKLRSLGYSIPSEKDQSEKGSGQAANQDDLCQQIRMAEAAEGATRYAGAQVAIGAISIALLFAATWFAGRAAKYAKEAAVSTAEAVRVSQQDSRAWLMIRSLWIDQMILSNNRVHAVVGVQAENVGRTVARNVTMTHIAIFYDGNYDYGSDISSLEEMAKESPRVFHKTIPSGEKEPLKLSKTSRIRDLDGMPTHDNIVSGTMVVLVAVSYGIIDASRGMTRRAFIANDCMFDRSTGQTYSVSPFEPADYILNILE